jgi:methylglutaconyl-CoA hydratase
MSISISNVILKEKVGKTLILTLNRPERLNALNNELLRLLVEELSTAHKDTTVSGIIITGNGNAFCAGGDLKERLSHFEADSSLYGDAMLSRLREICSLIESIGKPVVAAINGHAFGGGVELALACDFRIVAEQAKLGLTEPKVGMIPGGGGTQRLPRLIGASRAKELLMLAEAIDTKKALDYGLVNQVVEKDDSVTEKSVQFLERTYQNAPLAIKMIKFSVNKGMEMSLSEGLDFEASCTTFLRNTADRTEGITAFQEKRKPHFIGE